MLQEVWQNRSNRALEDVLGDIDELLGDEKSEELPPSYPKGEAIDMSWIDREHEASRATVASPRAYQDWSPASIFGSNGSMESHPHPAAAFLPSREAQLPPAPAEPPFVAQTRAAVVQPRVAAPPTFCGPNAGRLALASKVARRGHPTFADGAATAIQSAFRGWHARQTVGADAVVRELAATQMQGWWWKLKAKAANKQHMAMVVEKALIAKKHKAAAEMFEAEKVLIAKEHKAAAEMFEAARRVESARQQSQHDSACEMQRLWRGRQGRVTATEERRREAAALRVECAWRQRRAHVRANEERRGQSACVVQRSWRGRQGRATAAEERGREAAALRLESAWRQRDARRAVKILRGKRTVAMWHASYKLQKLWRGHQGRARVAQEKAAEGAAVTVECAWRQRCALVKVEGRRKERSSLSVQRCWRGHRARAGAVQDRARESAALTVESAWRQRCAREKVEGRREGTRRQRSALVVQQSWRGHQVRTRADQETRRGAAAVAVESAWRQRRARHELVQRRAHQTTRRRASAGAVQRMWRGQQGRAQALGLKKRNTAAVTLENAWRRRCARHELNGRKQQQASAVTMQRSWRGRSGRVEVRSVRRAREQALVVAAIKMESVWRGHSARRLAKAARVPTKAKKRMLPTPPAARVRPAPPPQRQPPPQPPPQPPQKPPPQRQAQPQPRTQSRTQPLAPMASRHVEVPAVVAAVATVKPAPVMPPRATKPVRAEPAAPTTAPPFRPNAPAPKTMRPAVAQSPKRGSTKGAVSALQPFSAATTTVALGPPKPTTTASEAASGPPFSRPAASLTTIAPAPVDFESRATLQVMQHSETTSSPPQPKKGNRAGRRRPSSTLTSLPSTLTSLPDPHFSAVSPTFGRVSMRQPWLAQNAGKDSQPPSQRRLTYDQVVEKRSERRWGMMPDKSREERETALAAIFAESSDANVPQPPVAQGARRRQRSEVVAEALESNETKTFGRRHAPLLYSGGGGGGGDDDSENSAPFGAGVPPPALATVEHATEGRSRRRRSSGLFSRAFAVVQERPAVPSDQQWEEALRSQVKESDAGTCTCDATCGGCRYCVPSASAPTVSTLPPEDVVAAAYLRLSTSMAKRRPPPRRATDGGVVDLMDVRRSDEVTTVGMSQRAMGPRPRWDRNSNSMQHSTQEPPGPTGGASRTTAQRRSDSRNSLASVAWRVIEGR